MLFSLLKAVGHDVVSTQIINDRGIHICKSMVAWQKYGNEDNPIESGMKGDHLVGKYYVLFDKVYRQEVDKLVNNGLSEVEAKDKAPIFIEAKKMLVKWEKSDEKVRCCGLK